jgi:hypothetical protein
VLLLFVAIIALPASLVGAMLPAGVSAGDFSGGLWHGAAGRIQVGGRDCGALEWHLHPGELLHLALGVDATWAKGAFSLTGSGSVSPRGLVLRAVNGGGAIEDIAALTSLAGWHGTATVALDRVETDFSRLRALSGTIGVSNLHAASIGGNADLGGYTLQFLPADGTASGDITAKLADNGGPLEVAATLRMPAGGHTGTLTGTARERSAASGELRRALEELARLSPRDAQGRVPLGVEFAY